VRAQTSWKEQWSSQPRTIPELLRTAVLEEPTRRVFTFLDDAGREAAHCTVSQLDRKARAIAAELQGALAPGARALLLYPPGLDYIAAFCGCLYAGVVAVPAYPPNPRRLDRTLPRLAAILSDAEATAVLTLEAFCDLEQAAAKPLASLLELPWIATDAVLSSRAAQWRDPGIGPETVALLQYTSGSTAAPRGVIVTHGNLVHNLSGIHHAFDIARRVDVGALWLPPYHDMGLVGGVLTAIHSRVHSILMSPLTFLKCPLRWLEAIGRHRATVIGSPNFGYEMCVSKTTPEQRARLDLSSVTLAFAGAEPIRVETLDRFAEAFAPSGFRREAFYPCYGLAEATLMVSGGDRGAVPRSKTVERAALARGRIVDCPPLCPGGQTLVGCGRAIPGQEIRIVDPQTRRECPPGRVGEIWVRGPSVTQGYWRRPDDGAECYGSRLAGHPTGEYLRTGDLGFLDQTDLFVTGRLKDLIIVRGRNHYPEDIEFSVERSHADLCPGAGAAFTVDVAGEERLVVVQAVKSTLADPSAAHQAIRRVITERHQLRAHAVVLVTPSSIPKTTSGKIQRRACREAFLEDALNVVAEWREPVSPRR